MELIFDVMGSCMAYKTIHRIVKGAAKKDSQPLQILAIIGAYLTVKVKEPNLVVSYSPS